MGYDDDDWSRIVVPGFWASKKNMKKQRFGTYRKSFVLPERLQDVDELVLLLGMIDDFDQTYLNGQLIGVTNDGGELYRTNSYRTMRVYPISEMHLNREGRNILTVVVEDIGGDAGIYEGPVAITTLKITAD